MSKVTLNCPSWIVVHCSDTAAGRAEAVVAAHTKPIAEGGRGWPHAGYHFVIENGLIMTSDGRQLMIPARDGRICRFLEDEQPGIHAPGLNEKSIAICLVGRGEFTRSQIGALLSLITTYSQRYRIPIERVIGHVETDEQKAKHAAGSPEAKTCPRLDLQALRAELVQLEVAFALAVRGVRGIGIQV